MRRWWTSATRGDRIAVISLVITILGIIPTYIAIFATNNNAETSPSTQGDAPTTVSKIELARNALLTFPSNDFSDTCEVQKEDDSYEDDLAYAFCAAEPFISYLGLSIYDTTTAMNHNFGAYFFVHEEQSSPVDRDPRNCRSGKASKGTWAYRDDPEGNPVGRFVCYVDDSNNAAIAWTYNKRKIMIDASREDDNIQALYKWWEKHWSTRP
jgi:hypothetical protein